MLPLGQPADDGAHRRPAEAPRLRRDRRDRGLHGQRHPHLLRRRLRVRRAASPTPPRRPRSAPPGSVRNAMDAPRRAVPGHLRRRAHRHRPRRHRRRSTRAKGAMATIGLVARRQPARVRHRHHPGGRLHRALPREADLGPGVQRHHQHRHLRARARDLRLHRRRPAGRLLRRGLPRAARGGPAAVRRRRRGLLGGRRHPRGLRPGPQGHPRRQGRASTSPASSSATACGWGRAPRSTPTPTHRRPRGHRRQLPGRGRAPASASTRCSGANVRVRDDAVPRAHRRPRQRLPGRGRPPAGHRRRPVVRPPQRRAHRGGRRASATSASSATRPSLGAGREGLPVQDHRGRRRRQLVDRLGVPGRPQPVRRAAACPGLANVDITPEFAARVAMAYGDHAEEGHARSSPPATPAARPACSSGR